MFLRLYFFLLSGNLSGAGFSQAVVPPAVSRDNLPVPGQADTSLFTRHKIIPAGFKKEISAALTFFPELRDVPVRFRLKRSYATLKTRPTFASMFLPGKKRSYVITISSKTARIITPILFANLPEDARVGVIGHELSHVVDFSNKTVWQEAKVLAGHLSPSYLDSLEFNTDKICIQHGLGRSLEAWSVYIRKTMHTRYWRGAGYAKRGDSHYERYMNPGTIEKLMAHKKASSTDLAFSTILLPQPSNIPQNHRNYGPSLQCNI